MTTLCFLYYFNLFYKLYNIQQFLSQFNVILFEMTYLSWLYLKIDLFFLQC